MLMNLGNSVEKYTYYYKLLLTVINDNSRTFLTNIYNEKALRIARYQRPRGNHRTLAGKSATLILGASKITSQFS